VGAEGVTWYCILRNIYYETVVGWGCTRDGGNKKYELSFGIVTSWKDVRWLVKLKDLVRRIKEIISNDGNVGV
jgi:Holliday junction resolvasome RuvABC endonuclease subunit